MAKRKRMRSALSYQMNVFWLTSKLTKWSAELAWSTEELVTSWRTSIKGLSTKLKTLFLQLAQNTQTRLQRSVKYMTWRKTNGLKSAIWIRAGIITPSVLLKPDFCMLSEAVTLFLKRLWIALSVWTDFLTWTNKSGRWCRSSTKIANGHLETLWEVSLLMTQKFSSLEEIMVGFLTASNWTPSLEKLKELSALYANLKTFSAAIL